MSKLRDMVQSRRSSASISNSCIPGITSNDPFVFAKQTFQKMVSSSKRVNKITIIDPYASNADLILLAECFGGFSEISLEVIAKYKVFEDKNLSCLDKLIKCAKDYIRKKVLKRKNTEFEEKKKKVKEGLIDTRNYLRSNGIFGDIEFIHTKTTMHDRYYIFWTENIISSILVVGGSIGQKFGDHQYIIEVTDPYLEYCVLEYYKKMIHQENILEKF